MAASEEEAKPAAKVRGILTSAEYEALLAIDSGAHDSELKFAEFIE